ncbi:MAG: 1-deoxy-D-xylulose-5-phosphate synthase, partial [Clostridiales bacterium]
AESVYDCFTTGHASNSLSLALGLAAARDQNQGTEQIVAIIGDGALTGGMAFEALDHGGELQSKLLIVLNDNEMSIADNVGALAQHLMKLRVAPAYHKAKRDVEAVLKKIPNVGVHLANGVRRVKDTFKYFLNRGLLFEELGYLYLGPIDGHDIAGLLEMLRMAKKSDRPVILHVHTCKGKGYIPAEQDPNRFHGTSPFFVESGCAKNHHQPTCTDVFGETLTQLAAVDTDICAVTAAMADGVGLSAFAHVYPERFYDVGIAEQHAVSFAAGLAKAGKKPVVAIYSTFLQRAYDQVMEDICLQRLPVVLAVDRAGVVGEDGYSHQGIFDISYLRTMPGLTIVAPRDGYELRMMLTAAMQWAKPVAIRYPRDQADYSLPLPAPLVYGQAERLREGHDLAIAVCGTLVGEAMAAAEILSTQGIEARVINCRFIAPLDTAELVTAVQECGGRLLTVEDNIRSGGFGEACLEAVAAQGACVDIVAWPNLFLPQGKRRELLRQYGFTGEVLACRVKEKWFGEKRHEG